MSNLPTSLYSALVYLICLPLALVLGYFLATPLDPSTVLVVSIVLLLLLTPLLLRWHHAWLIASWNMSVVLFFLPGRPPLWLLLAGISLGIAVMQRAVNPEMKFLRAPPVTWPLLALTFVILVTLRLTGGVGLRALGGEVYGGKRYVLILGAVLGYFALISRPIPRKRAALYVCFFFFTGVTMAVGSLAGQIDRSFNFLFLIFPVESASALNNDVMHLTGPMTRVFGLPFLSIGVFCTMLAYYGAQGILNLRKAWRLLLLLAFTFVGLYGGFRSMLALFVLTFAILFYLEGLLQTRYVMILMLAGLLGGTGMFVFANRLPLSVQRSLAFVPVIPLDPLARISAQVSTEWRLQMWQDLVKQIPNYLLLGKGYAINPNELEISNVQALRGGGVSELSEVSGDYHNGPLSVIIPFGIWGSAAFLWFLVGSFRVLYRNHKYGDPAYGRLNAFLFAFFVAKAVFFFFVFGSLYSDLAVFGGLIGLSVSLNHGVAEPSSAPRPAAVPEPIQRPFVYAGVRKPAGA